MSTENIKLPPLLEKLEPIMGVLSIVWAGLLIAEFTIGLHPLLESMSLFIWGVFILDFILELVISPSKSKYLQKNILIIISLLVPALRIFRGVRLVRLIRFLSTINRSSSLVRRELQERGFDYILVLTVFLMFSSAVAMQYFEQLPNFGDALWFTAMLMTTIGSDFWPVTLEGRIVTWLLSLYSIAIFSYLTASIASLIIGKRMKSS